MNLTLPCLLLVALVAVQCGVTANLQSKELPVTMEIECRNERNTQNSVLQLLRTQGARDWVLKPDGDFIDIEVAFTVVTRADADKIDLLETQVKQVPGVVNVVVRRATKGAPLPGLNS